MKAKNKTVIDLFIEEALRNPAKIAVEFNEKRILYASLNFLSNQVALELTKRSRKGPVGVCLDRSIEMIAVILGILRAGRAYVPVDLGYPEERNLFVLKNSKMAFLISHNKNKRNSFLLNSGFKNIIFYNEILRESKSHSQSINNSDSRGDTYIIYTSGSTGSPKGVQMGHGSLLNLIKWQIEDFYKNNKGKNSRTLQYSPVGFDVSFQEIFTTLCSGGTLILISDQDRRNPEKILQILNEKRITRLFLPFIGLQQIASIYGKNKKLYLEEVVTAGEQLKITPAIKNFFEDIPKCSFYNQYGPTETHVVTSHLLSGSPAKWPKLPAIGKPIPGVKAFILDTNLSPVKKNRAGELYLGGECLARGYANLPKITKEKFIQNPFGKGIIYKTGDIVCKSNNNTLHFLGRQDDQIKIRGMRVELAEIEVILAQIDFVKQCSVVMSKFKNSTRLIAYIIPTNETKLWNCLQDVLKEKGRKKGKLLNPKESSEIHEILKKYLPSHMIPSAFVLMPNLPLTPSGKADRKALPKINYIERPKMASGFQKAEGQLEKKLIEIFKSILSVKNVGTKDNFFDLGADSLLLVTIHKKIKSLLKLNIPLTALFQYSTISSLSEYIEGLGRKGDWQVSDNPKRNSLLKILQKRRSILKAKNNG